MYTSNCPPLAKVSVTAKDSPGSSARVTGNVMVVAPVPTWTVPCAGREIGSGVSVPAVPTLLTARSNWSAVAPVLVMSNRKLTPRELRAYEPFGTAMLPAQAGRNHAMTPADDLPQALQARREAR